MQTKIIYQEDLKKNVKFYSLFFILLLTGTVIRFIILFVSKSNNIVIKDIIMTVLMGAITLYLLFGAIYSSCYLLTITQTTIVKKTMFTTTTIDLESRFSYTYSKYFPLSNTYIVRFKTDKISCSFYIKDINQLINHLNSLKND